MSGPGLALNADEAALREVAQTYVDRTCAVGDVRRLRAEGEGFRPLLWSDIVGMEWLGLSEPEDRGGSGAGVFHLGLVVGELGRRLVPSPLVTTATALSVLGSVRSPYADKVHADLLTGAAVATFAHQEGADYPDRIETTCAEKAGSGYRVSGRKTFVPHLRQAQHLVVSATSVAGDGPALLLIDRDAAGVRVAECRLVDGQPAGHVQFDHVEVPEEAVLVRGADAEVALSRALLRGSALAAAEIAGALTAVADLAFVHLREREQFGVRIGTFQALQHRAARMHVAVELTVSVVRAALRAIDAAAPDAPEAVHAAKAFAGDAFHDVARDALQMHGGLGMTDEADVGLYVKRALVARAQYGSSGYHKARVAELRLGDAG